MRIINTITHFHSGKQILYSVLRLWAHDRLAPIVLLTAPGQGESKINALRIALSKERNLIAADSFYGLTASEPFRWTVDDETGRYRVEAVVIYFRQSEQQKIRYVVHTMMEDLKSNASAGKG